MNSFFKPLLWLWLCFAFSAAFAQESAYRQTTDQAFNDLDKTGVSSQILYDRVFPAGVLYAPSNFEAWTPERFMQTRMKLYLVSYNHAGLLSDND